LPLGDRWSNIVGDRGGPEERATGQQPLSGRRDARERAGRSGRSPRRLLHQAGAGGRGIRRSNRVRRRRRSLELSSSLDFDLIVLDLRLPTVTGEEILTRLRAAGSSVPVIVLTTQEAISDRVAPLNAGADDYLTRPTASRSCSPASERVCGPPSRPTRARSCTGASPSTCILGKRTWVGGRSSSVRGSSHCSRR
jgi:CheY-like chemotaxis protein